jgi:hypothetical protein
MSIDPAISSSVNLKNVMSLSRLKIMPSGVYIFDFDGVISSRFEDDIYRLPPQDDEIQLIEAAAKRFQIHCEGMEQRYQRHLLYQAAAWKIGLPIQSGPALEEAIDAGRRAQLFILTARSGWHAVERLRQFVQATGLRPIEIYNIGRVKKDRQIDLLCREFHSKAVFFIDDSDAHLANADAISAENLRLVRVESDLQSMVDESTIRNCFRETLKAGMSKSAASANDGDGINLTPRSRP